MKRLAFTEGEYRRRLGAVQAEMAKEGLSALALVNLASVCYLSGFQTLGSYGYGLYALVVPAEGDPVLFSSDFESHNAKIDSWVTDVVTYEVMEEAPAARLGRLMCDRGLARGRVGVERGHYAMTVRQFDAFGRELPEAALVEASPILDRVKVVKSAEEIAVMRRTAALTTAGTLAGIEAAREGATDNDVAAAVYQTVISQGGEYFSLQPIVTSGRRSGIPHSTFRRNRLEKGDNVFIEVSASHERYSAPTLRTVALGEPDADVQRAFDGCQASVETLSENLRAGASSRDAATAAGRALRAIEPDLVWHGYYGYSVGLGFPPMCCDCEGGDITEETDYELRAGMVFHCSTSLRKIGAFGVTLGDTVLVTETGCEALTTVPRRLTIR